MEATYIIVGGGIAGVTCAETLAFLQSEQPIILISESSLIKSVTNLLAITQTLTQFDVQVEDSNNLTTKFPNIQVIHDTLNKVYAECNYIETSTGVLIKYQYLCLCTGAKPKLIPQGINNPYVLTIRDTDSIENFMEKLSTSRKLVIVGNGGIASELVFKLKNILVDWVIKDNHITATFVDPGAAEFLRSSLDKENNMSKPSISKSIRYEELKDYKSGAALGPDWYKSLEIFGASIPTFINIHYQVEVTDISVHEQASEYPVEVTLTDGTKLSCDLILSATGVVPVTNFLMTTALDLSPDKGIKVNEFMQTSIPNIYAAGDVCSPNWEHSKTWFPMKLWTQARQMGCYAAKCMSAALEKEVIYQDFCFELFTHTTRLFGYKVVLIGLFNGQKLGTDYEILFRMTKGHEYIKFVLQNGKLQGAVLIGDTDLEETCENLILNEIDLSMYKEDLLNPDIDIEDYFD